MWVESSRDSDDGTLEIREVGGDQVSGKKVDVHHKPYLFHPKKWHGTCGWQGCRWVITAYVTRGLEHCSDSELRRLRGLGFQLPCRKSTQRSPNNQLKNASRPKLLKPLPKLADLAQRHKDFRMRRFENSCTYCIAPRVMAVSPTSSKHFSEEGRQPGLSNWLESSSAQCAKNEASLPREPKLRWNLSLLSSTPLVLTLGIGNILIARKLCSSCWS